MFTRTLHDLPNVKNLVLKKKESGKPKKRKGDGGGGNDLKNGTGKGYVKTRPV